MLLNEDGKETARHREFFMPEHDFTKRATEINGLTLERLKEKGAKKFTKAASERLVNFLIRHRDYHIVCHSAKYDKDKVLKPAFKKVDNMDCFPPDERWRCTLVMANQVPNLMWVTLDDLLGHFGFDRGEEGEPHEALEDAQCAAKVYLKLLEMPEMKKSGLGFKWKWMADE